MNKENKNEKKYLWRFIVIMLLCLGLGYLTGRFLGHISPEDFSLGERGKTVLAIASAGLLAAMNLAAFFVSLFRVRKVKGMVKGWDGEDDELPARADRLLGLPMLLSSVVFIVSVLLFAVGAWAEVNSDFPGDRTVSAVLCGSLLFCIAWVMGLQNAVVTLLRKMNPEKQGSVFQTNFRKIWEGSCDELEQLMIAKAGYKAYQSMTTACLILWLVSLICMFFLDTGLLPIICVCAIWLAGTLSYQLEAMKLEKG